MASHDPDHPADAHPGSGGAGRWPQGHRFAGAVVSGEAGSRSFLRLAVRFPQSAEHGDSHTRLRWPGILARAEAVIQGAFSLVAGKPEYARGGAESGGASTASPAGGGRPERYASGAGVAAGEHGKLRKHSAGACVLISSLLRSGAWKESFATGAESSPRRKWNLS